MNKSVLVLETPESCWMCSIATDYRVAKASVFCPVIGKDITEKVCESVSECCPLKPLPKYKSMEKPGEYEYGIQCGWNGCIDAITGEKQMLNTEKTERNFKAGDIVKHFKREFLKGEYAKSSSKYLYKIIGFAEHTETKEKVVVYQALYKEEKSNVNFGIYVRPYDMFMSRVDHEKYPNIKQKYRFELYEGKQWKD